MSKNQYTSNWCKPLVIDALANEPIYTIFGDTKDPTKATFPNGKFTPFGSSKDNLG